MALYKQSRKKHKNSKLGCATCKRRRIKCKEQMPQCSNCVTHKVKCDYLTMTADEIAEWHRLKCLSREDADDDIPRRQSAPAVPTAVSKPISRPPIIFGNSLPVMTQLMPDLLPQPVPQLPPLSPPLTMSSPPMEAWGNEYGLMASTTEVQVTRVFESPAELEKWRWEPEMMAPPSL